MLSDYDVTETIEFLKRIEESIVEKDSFRLDELLNAMTITMIANREEFDLFGKWVCSKIEIWKKHPFPEIKLVLLQFSFNKDRFKKDVIKKVREFCKDNMRNVENSELSQIMADIYER
ncbi:hypothetical protein [Motiliproteus sp. MSK22-1]|uniref:hypothetical protein n=1 Tax=Motiliproteus sp. MSK22-1 TaxID=1897630 RepID=UPI000977E2BA|nr:hypothetical protein [Motiliproteus sp. MSK22-1]OMH31958.1 hypothetical protein BGP75_16080 [Motiliproteus sp. MSK22-1]